MANAVNVETGKQTSLAKVVFQKHDIDGDGKLSRDELQSMCYELGYFLSQEELEFAFARLDSDDSGYVSLSEFEHFWQTDDRFSALQLSADSMVAAKKIADFFRKFDADSSGKLDSEEFTEMYMEMCM